MVVSVALFAIGLILICLGGDRLVDAAVAIAEKIGIPQIVVGATIVSIGTTLPEVLVSTTAAFDGSASIAAGNAFGSIICNTSLIAGLSQTIRPSKRVETASLLWRAAFFFIIIAIMEIYGFMHGEYTRIMGFFLLVSFVLYAALNIARAGAEGSKAEPADGKEAGSEDSPLWKHLAMLVFCAVLLYLGANLLVDNGILIANAIGVPERVIAVTFIALGTSLPEFVTSLMSLAKGYANVGLGNILGANILNMLLVIGIPAAIAGIPLEESTYAVDIPLGAAVMAILTVPILIRKKASRVQGISLLAVYAGYCLASFA